MGAAPYWLPEQEASTFLFPMQAEICSQERGIANFSPVEKHSLSVGSKAQ